MLMSPSGPIANTKQMDSYADQVLVAKLDIF